MAYAKPDAVTDATTSEWDETARSLKKNIAPLPFVSPMRFSQYQEWESPIPYVVGRSTPTAERLWHLKEAVTHYAHATELSSRDYKAWLGLAWCVEESGDLARAVNCYRHAFLLSRAAVAAGLSDMWRVREVESEVVLEAGTALLRLHHSGAPGIREDEAREIGSAQSRMTDILSHPGGLSITPVVIGLGEKTEPDDLLQNGRDARPTVNFDLSGFGPESWSWLPKGWGFLVWDPRKTGEITSGRQLFGSVTWWIFWSNGYEPLSLLDDDGDGWLKGPELAGLAVWQDVNSDGRSQVGEVKGVEEMGIVAVRCLPTGRLNDLLLAQDGVRFADGHAAVTVDWLAQRAAPALARR